MVVNAKLAGRKAAISIDRWLNREDLRIGRELEGPYRTEYEVDTTGVLMQRQVHMQALDPATRGKTFAEVHVGYTAEEAVAEAKRCLACGICCDCHLCETACQANAIDYTQREQKLELNVGAVVLAPGYEIYRCPIEERPGLWPLPECAYRAGVRADSLRLRTLLRPCAAAFRPASSRSGSPSCSALDRAIPSTTTVRPSAVCMPPKKPSSPRSILGEGLQCDIFFMDLRAFSKGFEQYYHRAQELGVRYIRSRVPKIEEVPGTRNLIVQYLGENDRKLSAGIRPGRAVGGHAAAQRSEGAGRTIRH